MAVYSRKKVEVRRILDLVRWATNQNSRREVRPVPVICRGCNEAGSMRGKETGSNMPHRSRQHSVGDRAKGWTQRDWCVSEGGRKVPRWLESASRSNFRRYSPNCIWDSCLTKDRLIGRNMNLKMQPVVSGRPWRIPCEWCSTFDIPDSNVAEIANAGNK